MNTTPMNTTTMIALGELALTFGEEFRATLHKDGATPESDTTHTVMLGLIACTAASTIPGLTHYDVGAIAQYSFIHDLPEAYEGDTNSFDISEKDAEAKARREKRALSKMTKKFGPNSWMMKWLLEYEEQKTPEARLVRYLDKALPKITHSFNSCAAIKAMGKTYEDLVRANAEQLIALNEQYPELAEPLGPLMAQIMKMSEESW